MLTVQTPTSSFTLPSAWHEVTLGQYLQLYKRATQQKSLADDAEDVRLAIRKTISIFCPDEQMLNELGAVEEVAIVERLSFLSTVPNFPELPIPTRIGGVEPLLRLAYATIGQKWTIDNLIEKWDEKGEIVNYTTMAVPILAVYLYPLLTEKPFQDGQEKTIYAQIETLPVTEALTLSNHYLSTYNKVDPNFKSQLVITIVETKPNPQRKPSKWLPKWLQRYLLVQTARKYVSLGGG